MEVTCCTAQCRAARNQYRGRAPSLEGVGDGDGEELEEGEVALAHVGIAGDAGGQQLGQQRRQVRGPQHGQDLRQALRRPAALHAGPLLVSKQYVRVFHRLLINPD